MRPKVLVSLPALLAYLGVALALIAAFRLVYFKVIAHSETLLDRVAQKRRWPASATFLAAVSLTVGLINAACMSY